MGVAPGFPWPDLDLQSTDFLFVFSIDCVKGNKAISYFQEMLPICEN
jgi:hypothetical protein